jgi:ABC-type branched-subunit amino acid transport system ATPase component
MLVAQQVAASYGPRRVLDGCGVEVGAGRIVALFGHNGAGKTSLLRIIAGLKRPDAGTVELDGSPIDRLSTARRARAGLAFVPDGASGVFPNLTVDENLAMASLASRSGNGHGRETVLETFPILREKARQEVSRLSGGQRQMVALGIAMARQPKFMLLDEPSIGLAPRVVEQVMQSISLVAETLGIGVLIVEQDIHATLAVADHVLIMKSGEIVLSRPARDFPTTEALWEFF